MIGQVGEPVAPFITKSDATCLIEVCDGDQSDLRAVQYATGMTIGIRIVWPSISFRNASDTYNANVVQNMPFSGTSK